MVIPVGAARLDLAGLGESAIAVKDGRQAVRPPDADVSIRKSRDWVCQRAV